MQKYNHYYVSSLHHYYIINEITLFCPTGVANFWPTLEPQLATCHLDSVTTSLNWLGLYAIP